MLLLIESLPVECVAACGSRNITYNLYYIRSQTKIDHVFVSMDWEMLYSDCHLQAGGSSMSDHYPVLVSCSPFHRRYKGFWFETCWLVMPGFTELVAQSWATPIHSTNKARVLHIKLARLAKMLKNWNKQRMSVHSDKKCYVINRDRMQVHLRLGDKLCLVSPRTNLSHSNT
jgi:hypothetical protein